MQRVGTILFSIFIISAEKKKKKTSFREKALAK